MIKTFKNKALRDFFEGREAKVTPAHHSRLTALLTRLNASQEATDMDLPGWNFHPLKGRRKDCFSVSVNKNWRLIFKFTDSNAYSVDYLDYH